MTLFEPIPVLPADDVGPVHFIAIGGAGMSGIAQLYAERGIEVTGSDQADSPALRRLAAAGIRTFVGHRAEQIGNARTVVVSSAVKESNPELAAARDKGLLVWHRSAALAALMLGRTAVSVSGTHGKTTTSAMTATMLAAAGADPSYVVGSPLQDSGSSAHLGAGSTFVVEADESDGSFRQYPTVVAVVSNIEAYHLDNWLTPEAYAAGFVQFCTSRTVRTVVLDSDDPGCRRLHDSLRRGSVSVTCVGEGDDADIRLSHIVEDGTAARATLTWPGGTGELRLAVPGRHNLHNAAAAFAVGHHLGLDPQLLLEGAAGFAGTERRFQFVAEVAGVRVVDDYAHHPTEIAATLTAARAAAGTGRVVACFQPHLYSRTRDFAVEFGQALAAADVVVVTDVYAAREEPMAGVSSELVVRAARDAGADVTYVPALADVPAALAGLAREGDLILTLGAGDITTAGPLLAELLEARRG
ncbi:MAG: UDP-N-acetylmuramate--L-alanine ligase [Actinobacteria bacterium]|nr:UDP-N-acetylmuramate--L-alanine ligase [Actinomycetota bacterium]